MDDRICDAIKAGLEVLADNDIDEPARDDVAQVFALAEKIGVKRMLEALRDGADCAADVALGSEHSKAVEPFDPFDGITQADLRHVRDALIVAIGAVS